MPLQIGRAIDAGPSARLQSAPVPFNRALVDRRATVGFGSGLSSRGRDILSVLVLLAGLGIMRRAALASLLPGDPSAPTCIRAWMPLRRQSVMPPTTEREMPPKYPVSIDAFLGQYSNESTVYGYGHALREFADFAVANGEQIQKATPALFDLYLQDQRGKGRRDATIRTKQQAIVSYYAYLVDRKILRESPIPTDWKIKTPDALKVEATLTRDEIDSLLKLAGTSRERIVIRLIAMYGFRPGQLEKLAARDAHVEIDGTVSLPMVGKGHTSTVTLDPETSAVIVDELGGRSTGPLLVNKAGNAITQKGVQVDIDNLTKRAGIKLRTTANLIWKSVLAAEMEEGTSARALADIRRTRTHRLVSLAPRSSGPARTQTVARIAADLGASEVLSQAERLQLDPAVHPAAVALLGGCALEMTLRGLCEEHDIEIQGRPSIGSYAGALRQHRHLTDLDKKLIDAWGALRNLAAHGHLDDVQAAEATEMLAGITRFVGRQESPTDDDT